MSTNIPAISNRSRRRRKSLLIVVLLLVSPNIIRMIKSRRMRWAGQVARMGEKRNTYRILVGKPEGREPLGRPTCRWVDNIKIDLREIGWDGIDWIDLAQRFLKMLGSC
jgi:hypothetical protein